MFRIWDKQKVINFNILIKEITDGQSALQANIMGGGRLSRQKQKETLENKAN